MRADGKDDKDSASDCRASCGLTVAERFVDTQKLFVDQW